MTARLMRRSAIALGAGLAATALVVSGCGGQQQQGTANPQQTAKAPAADPKLAAMVPDKIKADGKIVVGTDSTYAPAEFLDQDGKTVIGFDVDLFNAVAGKLGLRAEYVSAPFGAIITGVSSGKYEVGVSSFTINDERKQQANMVSYFNVGTQWATKKSNPAGVSIDEPCGKRIAVQKDTVQVPDIEARSKKCTDAGKPAVTIDQYQGQDQATAAVVSGKDDAMLADYPVAAYAVRQTNGQLELLGQQYEAAPYGYVIPKDQTQFAQAVAEAVKAIIADGTYAEILKKWGVEQGALANPAVNP
ncbi:ABC transporter substrate-binding protein [Carbonactinospora thermoautotrophica]|nr:ABC transporter substrate-binding protein [Carbonactinospora thermoautotrophica]